MVFFEYNPAGAGLIVVESDESWLIPCRGAQQPFLPILISHLEPVFGMDSAGSGFVVAQSSQTQAMVVVGGIGDYSSMARVFAE